MESSRYFSVEVTMPDGYVFSYPIYATTKWHAIEIMYSRLSTEQEDRSKYRVVKIK
jgi:hypothetical protein